MVDMGSLDVFLVFKKIFYIKRIIRIKFVLISRSIYGDKLRKCLSSKRICVVISIVFPNLS